MRTRTLSDREENVVNTLREHGYTINMLANMFDVSKDVIANANPVRRAYLTGYNACKSAMTRKLKMS